MKTYQVFYWIKKNKKEYLNHIFVVAKNQKEACKIAKNQVFEKTGRNAFRATTKPYSEKELDALRKYPRYVID